MHPSVWKVGKHDGEVDKSRRTDVDENLPDMEDQAENSTYQQLSHPCNSAKTIMLPVPSQG